ASKGDLRRQLLVESVLIAVLAATAAVMLCMLLLAGAVPFGPRAGSIIASYRVDGGGVLFAAALPLGCGLACGALAGAFALPRELGSSLQATASADSGGGHDRVRSSLVVLEVALSVVLLVGASLLGRTLFQLTSVDPGMKIPGLLGQEL